MNVRLVLPILLLSLPATAQQGDADQKAPPAATPAAPAAQEPKPADVIGELQREKERLEAEIGFARARAGSAKADLAAKFQSRKPAFRGIQAGTNVAAPAAPAQLKKARLMTKEELQNQPQDVLAVVSGRAIRRGMVDEVMGYLKQAPAAGDDAVRAQRVMFDLIRAEAVAAAFPENPAEGRLGDLMGELEQGKPLAELVKSFGTLQGAQEDGRLEVTRNSFLGARAEQVAFSLAQGQRSRPFVTPQGYALFEALETQKGASPELDKVVVRAVLVPWQADPAELQKAQAAAVSGQLDIAVRDDEVMKMLPALYRPVEAPAAQPAGDAKVLGEVLAKLQAEAAALAGKTDDQSQSRLAELGKQIEQVKAALAAATDAAADGVEIKLDADAPPVKKAPEKKQD